VESSGLSLEVTMRPARSLPLLVLCVAAAGLAADAPPESLIGFSPARVAGQRSLEQRFDAALDPAELKEWMRRLSARPHHLGSPYGKDNAEFIAAQFRSWGFDTKIEEFRVLFPTPKTRVMEMVAPTPFRAALAEPALKEDATSDQAAEQLPVYNAYSIDGDVTGDLVYVNQGVPRDYEELERRGIDVKGKIVLTRYGGSWRGIKPKVAAEHGAIGCIIYSDPRDDGYFQGDVYPDGPNRGWGMIQRGSVMELPRYPGDPSTPNGPSTAGAERLAVENIPTLPTIPVQPMSYRDGIEILKRLKGPVAPEAWRGALPITYHVGPGPAKIHMALQMNYGQRRLINVTGRIAGGEFPDEWIIIGSHRDAWVFGASDSVSGHVSMMTVARGLSEMMKNGWKPRRSILFVSWDGEEPGLLGSTEWVEDRESELKAKTAVYINRDAGAGGPFCSGSAVHSLTPFVHELEQSVDGDQTSKHQYGSWLESA